MVQLVGGLRSVGVTVLVGLGGRLGRAAPDGSYKLSGDRGGLWWVAGLCRFEPRELDNLAQFVSSVRRLPDDALIDDVLIDHVR